MTQDSNNEQARIDMFVLAVFSRTGLSNGVALRDAQELLAISDRIAQERREAVKTTEVSGK